MPIGKSSKDIFSSTEKKPAKKRAPATEPTAPPAPKKHPEPYTKATIVLLNRQVAFLDRLGTAVFDATGKTLKRAAILRALIDALEASGIEPEALRSEEHLRKLASKRLKG